MVSVGVSGQQARSRVHQRGGRQLRTHVPGRRSDDTVDHVREHVHNDGTASIWGGSAHPDGRRYQDGYNGGAHPDQGRRKAGHFSGTHSDYGGH